MGMSGFLFFFFFLGGAKNWRPFRGRSEGVDDGNRRERRGGLLLRKFSSTLD